MMAINRVCNEYGDGAAWIRGSLIGKGSFGRVYKANSRSKYSCFPSEMAVKSAEFSVSGTLQKEKEIIRNLNRNPYIIGCFGEDTTIGHNGVMTYNLLLEYASGGTLADRINNRGLPELEVRAHTRSILRGLRIIHAAGYVHRDLKPPNILMLPNAAAGFRAKIGDFGLAKRATNNNKRKLIETCYWRGTPVYLSPEAVIDCVQEAPSDVWAVGCIVLEMLTGKSPWEGTKEEILTRIGAKKELPTVPNHLISNEASDFLKRCFVRNPTFRFTAEMLLNHPFVEGLCDDVDDEEGLDEECSSELFSDEDYSFCSSSEEEEEDSDDMDDEVTSKDLPSQLERLRRHTHPVGSKIPLGI